MRKIITFLLGPAETITFVTQQFIRKKKFKVSISKTTDFKPIPNSFGKNFTVKDVLATGNHQTRIFQKQYGFFIIILRRLILNIAYILNFVM
jgi:hypothetical protein